MEIIIQVNYNEIHLKNNIYLFLISYSDDRFRTMW